MKLQHLVNEETKEVFVNCNSAITAMGIGSWVKKYYPGYTAKIVSKEFFDELGQS